MNAGSPETPYDVAIIGFGPVGATLAGLLGKRGWKVAVFDKSTEIFPLPRAIGLDHEVMRIFQALGHMDALLPHTAPYRPSVYLGCDRQPILRFDIAPPPFPLAWRPNYTFNQPKLEAWLRERVTSFPNVSVTLGVTVTGIEEQPDAVRLTLDGGDTSSVDAKFVVGCDGANSMVRRIIGTGVEDLAFDEHWLVIDVMLSDAARERLPDTNIQYCQPERPSTYVVLPGNHRRWEIMINEGERAQDLLAPEALWKLLSAWVTPNDAELWRAAAYRFHAVVCERWRSGRIFLAGDAAHQMPPFLAQGMCQGVRDAANLEWKLDLVLKGQASDKLLDSYEAERKPNVIEVTATVKKLGAIICERDPVAARKRDKEALDSQGGVVKTKIRQELIPGLKHGMISHAHPCAGTQFPQPLISKDGQSPVMLDDLTGTRFRIVVKADDNGSAGLMKDARLHCPDAAVIACGDDGTLSIDGTQSGIDTDKALSRWFAQHQCAAAIVRPDGYVFGAVKTAGEVPQLVSELRSHLAP
jgi:3-(3-hydroxy-phenyl)propionate hydroxylase